MDQTFEKRKKVIYDFICDDLYVPMKIKEIAVVLQIPRDTGCPGGGGEDRPLKARKIQ